MGIGKNKAVIFSMDITKDHNRNGHGLDPPSVCKEYQEKLKNDIKWREEFILD